MRHFMRVKQRDPSFLSSAVPEESNKGESRERLQAHVPGPWGHRAHSLLDSPEPLSIKGCINPTGCLTGSCKSAPLAALQPSKLAAQVAQLKALFHPHCLIPKALTEWVLAKAALCWEDVLEMRGSCKESVSASVLSRDSHITATHSVFWEKYGGKLWLSQTAWRAQVTPPKVTLLHHHQWIRKALELGSREGPLLSFTILD